MIKKNGRGGKTEFTETEDSDIKYVRLGRSGIYIGVGGGTSFRSQLKHGADNHFYRGGATAKSLRKRCGHLVEKAIEKGILTRGPCEVCNTQEVMSDGRSIVQAHHDDYSKPLEVRWLCQQHHYEWHQSNKPKS